jgi:hypothetical protein
VSTAAPRLPAPRGPLSTGLLSMLAGDPEGEHPPEVQLNGVDPLLDEDLELALYVLYELHYRGFERVDEAWEWDPGLLALRARLERRFLSGVRARAPHPGTASADDMDLQLRSLIADYPGPPLSRYLETQGTLDEFRELVVHRSVYHLKEADPHSWALPRLGGKAKAALVEIQADEYGGGDEARSHAALYAAMMAELGLDPTYGAYVDAVPAPGLAAVNLMSCFGLHRRWRGAIIGHLAVFEMTSTEPNRRYGNGLRRLGLGPPATAFYDEHVEADAVHESIAANDLAGSLAREDPALAGDVMFGARALLAIDALVAERQLAAWADGRSALRAAPA